MEARESDDARNIAAWWKAKRNDAHSPLSRLVEHLRQWESPKRQEILLHLAMYGDTAAKGFLGRRLIADPREERLSFNLVKSIIDTAQSEISSSQPRPRFLTSRGDWTQKRRAQSMEQVLAADYERCDVYAQKDRGFLDAAKIGYCALKVFSEDGLPKVELVPPGQLIVDPVEGQYRNPRNLVQLMTMSRDVAHGMYGDRGGPRDRAISAAPQVSTRLWFPWLPIDPMVDQIMVLEAWHLPDPETWRSAKTGRHVVCVDTGTLVDEEWKRGFPFAIWRYDEESTGYWGHGVVRNVRPIQRELNYVLQKIQDCISMSAGFRHWVQGDSKVNVEKMTNEPGTILRYFGSQQPTTEVINAVPAELFKHAEDLITRGYAQEGVSMQAAIAKKQPGLNSGAALREQDDIDSSRFVVKSKSFERFIGVELPKLIVEQRNDIASDPEQQKAVRVRERRGRGFKMVDVNWKKASLNVADYQIQTFPSSALPTTPPARLATVREWIQAGLVNRDQALQLLDFPDVEGFVSMELAAYDAVLDAIEAIIEDGEYAPPSPTLNLELAIDLVTAAHLKFTCDRAPEDRLEMLLRFLDDIRFLQDQAKQGAAQQAPAPNDQPAQAPGMAPGAAPPMAA